MFSNNRYLKLLGFFCVGLLLSSYAQAVGQIQVVALFKNKAMIEVDGRRHLVKAGEKTPEGVMLVSATPEEAVLEFDGKRERFELGSRVGGQFAKRTMAEVKIPRAPNGAYFTMGSINGRVTTMLVDTGATSIAMSEVEAKRLGVPYRINSRKILVKTASGATNAYLVMLDRVQVGEIVLRQIEGYVVQGSSPTQVLLGMSFLNKIEMRNKGNLMILRGKL